MQESAIVVGLGNPGPKYAETRHNMGFLVLDELLRSFPSGWQEKFRASPWMVPLKPSGGNGITKDVAADTFQVKSASLKRFQKRLGVLSVAEMEELSAGLAICLGLD